MCKIIKSFFALTLILALMCGCGNGNSLPESNGSEELGSETSQTSEVGPEFTPSIARPTSPELVMVCGGSSGGTMFLLANAITLILNQNYSDVFSATAQSTTGTPAILQLLQDGEADFGWGASNTARDAFEGVGNYDEEYNNLASVIYGYVQVCQFVAKNSDNINGLEDLRGMRFGVSNAGSTTELNARQIFALYGMDYINKNDIIAQYIGESQAGDLISNNQLDGVLANAPLGSSGMLSLMSSGDCKLISLSDEVINELCEKDSSFIPFTIPAGTYENQGENIKTVAVVNYIYCRKDLPNELVYWFCDAIYNNIEDLKNTHAVAAQMLPENVGLGMTIPIHSGAELWLEDHGYTVNN